VTGVQTCALPIYALLNVVFAPGTAPKWIQWIVMIADDVTPSPGPIPSSISSVDTIPAPPDVSPIDARIPPEAPTAPQSPLAKK